MCKNERKKVICTNCDATKAYCLIASKTSRKKIRLVNVYPWNMMGSSSGPSQVSTEKYLIKLIFRNFQQLKRTYS